MQGKDSSCWKHCVRLLVLITVVVIVLIVVTGFSQQAQAWIPLLTFAGLVVSNETNRTEAKTLNLQGIETLAPTPPGVLTAEYTSVPAPAPFAQNAGQPPVAPVAHASGINDGMRFESCGASFMGEIGAAAYGGASPSSEQKRVAKEFGHLFIPRDQLHPAAGSDGKVPTCALVSSGGALKGSGLGPAIDKHDLVFRANAGGVALAKVLPEDAGSRTNVLFMNHPDMAQWCYNENMHDKGDYRRCVPHVLFPDAKVPPEPMQFVVGFAKSGYDVRSLLEARATLGADAWRLQLFSKNIIKAMPKGLRFGKASAGMMAFWIATSLCKEIQVYGFAGKLPGKSYHAYEWCDVDKVMKPKADSKDCNFSRRHIKGKKVQRTASGFNKVMSDHDFGGESKKMHLFGTAERLKTCFAKCPPDC